MKERTQYKILLVSTILLIGLAVYLYFNFNIISESDADLAFLNDEPASDSNMNSYLLTFSLLLIISSNIFLNLLLDKFLIWKEYAMYRFIIQMFLGTSLSLLSFNLAYLYIKQYFTGVPAGSNQIVLLNIYGASLILPIYSLFFGFKFLRFWRKSELETQRLQSENMRSQMMTLRNHLDPHFLFNNLNAVSSLIDQDTELSKKYLDKFAEVYRIILRSEYSDLCTVEEELKLINSYVYMIKIRFKDRVVFNIHIDEADMQKAIAPLSLQMLLENAIKHNFASLEKPLTINVTSLNGKNLKVSNNKKIKKYGESNKSGTGLKNIQDRYAFFTKAKMIIKETSSNYSVRIPLLEIE